MVGGGSGVRQSRRCLVFVVYPVVSEGMKEFAICNLLLLLLYIPLLL